MNQSLCCRSVAPQHLLQFAIALAYALLTQQPQAIAQELEQAIIRVAKADVHCGPDADYYATTQLKRGERVSIIEKGIDGWVAIVPPSQSFCWIAGRDCKLLTNGKEIEIIADKTVCWIGSTLKQTEYRWQSELARGTKVTILGEAQRQSDDGANQLWYRIAPPSDELRWIRIEHLGTADDLNSNELGSDSSATTAPDPIHSNSATVPSKRSANKEKSVLADNDGKPDRKISLATAYEPIAAPKPPRTLIPSGNASPIQRTASPSSTFEPGPTAAGYFDQQPSPRNTFVRPTPAPQFSPMNRNARPIAVAQPAPQWDQFQAFPSQSPAPSAMMIGQTAAPYTSQPVSPLEWLFADFIHRNDTGNAPNAMIPTPDATVQSPQAANRSSYPERTYSPDQPFQSRIAQLPRPGRRSLSRGFENGGNDYPTLAADPRGREQAAYPQPLDSPMRNDNFNSQASTADYRSDQASSYATTSTWHGIQMPGNNVATASDAQPLTEPADASAPVNISSPELQQIQFALSREVANPIEQWNLASFKSTIEERLQQSNDPLYRGEARLLIERIDAFIQLKNRSTHTVPASSQVRSQGPLMPSNPETPAMWINAGQYDASGWLVPVHATHTGQPEYAITDDRGNTIAYVTAPPGVNLRRYLRQPVGLKGRRGYLPELSANHIVVERAVSLQR